MRNPGPAMRSILTLIVVILLTATFLVVRGLAAAGFFTSVIPGFAGRCTAIGGVNGAGALQIDAADGLAFLAVSDRRKASARDGLYTLNLAGAPKLTRLPGSPPGFHPRALSLARGPDGAMVLMAVNRRDNGLFSVEIFDVKIAGGTASLSPRASVQGGLLVDPGGVAAVGPDSFYVTNQATAKNPLLRALEDYALLRQADVLYFDGMSLRVVAKGLDRAAGIALSPDGAHVYVAAMLGRTLHTYAREPFTGTLMADSTFAIAAGLDQVTSDGQGNLWVAGHPSLMSLNTYRQDPAAPAASQIFKVTMQNGVPLSAVPVYADQGTGIGGASVGAVAGKRLLIGSALDDKILDCREP